MIELQKEVSIIHTLTGRRDVSPPSKRCELKTGQKDHLCPEVKMMINCTYVYNIK
jgi:hypothetical protein